MIIFIVIIVYFVFSYKVCRVPGPSYINFCQTPWEALLHGWPKYLVD